MIKKIDSKYQVVLSYSWLQNPHNLCGHVYEVIEYYYILKEFFSVCIFLNEEAIYDNFEKIIRQKYTFTDEEIQNILENTVFGNKPKIVACTDAVFILTDGNVKALETINIKIYAKQIIALRCEANDFSSISHKNVTLLQDKRVYQDKIDRSIQYVKKLLLSKLRRPSEKKTDAALIYVTKNCRYMSIEQILELIDDYHYSKYYVLTDDEILRKNLQKFENIVSPELPVENVFNLFDEYIYTPISRHFDCSPRFIVECHHFNKKVSYWNIDYEDFGLHIRTKDIEEHFNQLELTNKDSIIDVISGILHE